MTHMEAMAALAQGIINIDGGLRTIEPGSRIYRGMLTIVEEEAKTIEALREVEAFLRRQTTPAHPKSAINRAHAIVKRLLQVRTDPEFEES